MTSLHQGFARIAEEIEARLDLVGWDVPSSLWVITDADVPEDVRDEVDEEHGSCFVLAYSTSLHDVLDGHPADALIGVQLNDAVGVALCTEGWAYSVANLERFTRGEKLPAPSACDDSVEVRLVYLVMRDGTEAMVERRSGEDSRVLTEGDFSGIVVWSLRRVLNRPSLALSASTPSINDVTRRMVAQAVVNMCTAERVAEEFDQTLLLMLLAGIGPKLASLFEPHRHALGLNEQTWDAALDVARSLEGDGDVLRYLKWADAGMYAEMLHARFSSLAESVQVLESFGELGADVARLITAG
jgi:hypothetical protein